MSAPSSLLSRLWRQHALALAGIIAALTVISACAGALILANDAGQHLISQLERDASQDELDLYAEMRREEGSDVLVRAIARHARVAGAHHVYALSDSQGHMLAGNLTSWPELPGQDADWIALPTEAGPDSIHVSVRTLPDGMRILAGRDNEMQAAFGGAVLKVALLAIAIVAVACLLAPTALVALTVRSVGELSRTAARITSGEFGARTPTHGGPGSLLGPFDRIARSQNAMLDRIEDLVTGLKTVTDSLAHDLRTPLARLRGALERGLNARTEDEKHAALETALGETEKTIFAFSSLIDIARAEGGLSREAMVAVDLDALMHDVHELFQPLAEERGVRMKLHTTPSIILGHKPLLMQAVGNLVHNGIKYSPPGGELDLHLAGDAWGARIIVADRGPGIPADQRADAVKRFQRLGSGDTPEGVGLGLAIVEACARLHRGALALEDNDPGLKAALILHA